MTHSSSLFNLVCLTYDLPARGLTTEYTAVHFSFALQSRWKIYWARYWCFGSQKHEKRIVPASRGDGGSGPAGTWPLSQSGPALAPPSSPASFVNSLAHSPASFTLPSAVSASMASPSPINPMFSIGPYAHETQLVSPPVFSTFTTEPSTAPLTPPPELSHRTTPSSPDVPFAKLISSSLKARDYARGNISPFSTSTIATPCDTPQFSGPLYLGSPVNHLISPAPEGTGTGSSSSVPSFLPQPNSYTFGGTSSFPAYEPFACAKADHEPFAALILPCDSNSSVAYDEKSKGSNGY